MSKQELAGEGVDVRHHQQEARAAPRRGEDALVHVVVQVALHALADRERPRGFIYLTRINYGP